MIKLEKQTPLQGLLWLNLGNHLTLHTLIVHSLQTLLLILQLPLLLKRHLLHVRRLVGHRIRLVDWKTHALLRLQSILLSTPTFSDMDTISSALIIVSTVTITAL